MNYLAAGLGNICIQPRFFRIWVSSCSLRLACFISRMSFLLYTI